VKFNSVSPSYYTTTWHTGNIYWSICSPPDSSSLNAKDLTSSLKSKFLQGKDLSGLTIYSFTYETAQGFSYEDYLSYVHSPALIQTKHMPESIRYSKSF